MKSFFLKITLIFVLLISYGCSYQSALAPIEKDPYEEMNRSIYEFNENLDKTVLEPVADSYDFVMPELFQTGVQNFFNNANYPVTIVNQALQGKFSASFESLFRFTINTTIGIGGLFDPAKSLGYELKSEDFGQTLGVWGFDSGSYLMTPLFGPYTVRHAFGDVFDNSFRISIGIVNLTLYTSFHLFGTFSNSPTIVIVPVPLYISSYVLVGSSLTHT